MAAMIRTSVAPLSGLLPLLAPADLPRVLSSDGEGGLRKDGKPFRAIGMNYFSCFYPTLLGGADSSYQNSGSPKSRANRCVRPCCGICNASARSTDEVLPGLERNGQIRRRVVSRPCITAPAGETKYSRPWPIGRLPRWSIRAGRRHGAGRRRDRRIGRPAGKLHRKYRVRPLLPPSRRWR